MTNYEITRLKAAAEECMKPHGYLTAEYFQALANPAAILSLLERLREAEAIVAQNACGCKEGSLEPCRQPQREFPGCGYNARTYLEKYK